jgi:hypothetical protein
MKQMFAASICALAFLCGCGGGQAEKTMGGGEAFVFPELDTFDSEAFLAIGYPAARGNWAEVKKYVTSDKYKAAITKFESAALPSQYSSRQTAKDELVTAAKEIAEKAKSNAPNSELDAAWKKIAEAKGKLMAGDAPG